MAPRRSSSAAEQLCLFDQARPDERLSTTLDRLTEARQLVADMLVSPPEVLPLSSLPVYERPDDHRLVLRTGRLKADGSRAGARVMRKMTVYLTPETVEELDLYCAEKRKTYSDVIDDAIFHYLETR